MSAQLIRANDFTPPAISDAGSGRSAKSRLKFCRDYNFSTFKFHDLVNSGELRAVKIGSKTVVLDVDEAAWLASLKPAVAKAA